MYIIIGIRIAKSEPNSVPITIRSQSHSQLQLHFKVMYPVHNSEGLEPPGSSVPAAMGLITSDQMSPHLQSPPGFTGFLA